MAAKANSTKTKATSTTAKPKKASKANEKAQPTSPVGNFRYAGSLAEQMDNLLLAGGSYADLAAKIIGRDGKQIRVSALKSHAHFRAKSGKYLLEENGENAKLVAVSQ